MRKASRLVRKSLLGLSLLLLQPSAFAAPVKIDEAGLGGEIMSLVGARPERLRDYAVAIEDGRFVRLDRRMGKPLKPTRFADRAELAKIARELRDLDRRSTQSDTRRDTQIDRQAAATLAAIPAPEAWRTGAALLFDGGRLEAETSLQGDWSARADFANGRLRRWNMKSPSSDTEVEVGDLAAGGLSPALGSSPYWSVTKGHAGSGDWLDHQFRGQASYVNLEARNFPEVPAPQYQGGFTKESYYVFSGLAQAGRAYPLYGPVDAAWSALGVFRRTQAFPNASFDESVGLRARIGQDHSLGLFTGVTQAVGLLSEDWANRAVSGLEQQAGMEKAPHSNISLWGRLPWRQADYAVDLGRQDNPMTEVSSLRASLGAPAGAGRLSVYGAGETEVGRRIEFDRRRSSLGASWAPDGRTRWFAEYGRQDFRFGDAEVKSRQVMVGLELSDKYRTGAGVTLESSFGGREKLTAGGADFQALAGPLAAGLSQLETALNQALAVLETTNEDQAWLSFTAYYNHLPADTRAAIEAELGPADRDDFDLPAWITVIRQGAGGLAQAKALVGDPAFLDRTFTRYARAALQKSIGETELEVLGAQVRLTPPALLALLHAYSLGVSPLPPVGRDLLSGPLDQRVLDQINRKFGSACSGDFKTVSACLIEHVPADKKAALEAAYGKDLPIVLGDSMALMAQVLRRELNVFLLSAMLAAEKLDALSVDRGQRLGEMNKAALTRSFALLDQRRRAESAPPRVLARAEGRLREELARQDADIAGRLREHGPKLLASLVSQPSWPSNVSVSVPQEHWPALLSRYGSESLALFLRQAASKLGQKAGFRMVRLRLEFKNDPDLGLSLTRGDILRLTLPPLGPGRDPASALEAILSAL
ncbi:MAG: hypothetical protein AAB320_01930 [Elusimicrobiota bacterium]